MSSYKVSHTLFVKPGHPSLLDSLSGAQPFRARVLRLEALMHHSFVHSFSAIRLSFSVVNGNHFCIASRPDRRIGTRYLLIIPTTQPENGHSTYIYTVFSNGQPDNGIFLLDCIFKVPTLLTLRPTAHAESVSIANTEPLYRCAFA